MVLFFFQAEDGIRDRNVTGVQTCALPMMDTMDWKEITTIEEWDDILNKSAEKDQVILKHSTTCPASTNALDEYNDYLQHQPNEKIDYTMVKVRESRTVSNKIEEDLNVKHESPQIIYIQNKAKYWSATHWSVTKAHMKAVID